MPGIKLQANILVIALFGFITNLAGQPHGLKNNVFKITASGHRTSNRSIEFTGFVLKGVDGVVTSLHGVIGFKVLILKDSKGNLYSKDVKIKSVSIRDDLAVLSSPELVRNLPKGFESSTLQLKSKDQLVAIGFPNGIDWVKDDLYVENSGYSTFKQVIPTTSSTEFSNRASPDLEAIIIRIQGSLSPGYSGAPILDKSNRVVGIGCGGVNGGASGISWAIPIAAMDRLDKFQENEQIRKLIAINPTQLFSCETSIRRNVTAIGRLSLGIKFERIFEKQSSLSGFNEINALSFFLLGHPRILMDRVGFGYSYYTDRKFTSINTFVTLKEHKGFNIVDYYHKRSRAFARYYLNGQYDSYRLFNAYIGVGINFINESPLNKKTYHIDDSETFVEERSAHQTIAVDYSTGIRFAKRWYTIDLEASYFGFDRKSENFVFNVFGNAVPHQQEDKINTFSISLGIQFNLSMLE